MDFKEKIKDAFSEYKVVDAKEEEWILKQGDDGVILCLDDYNLCVIKNKNEEFDVFVMSYADDVNHLYFGAYIQNIDETIKCINSAIHELI